MFQAGPFYKRLCAHTAMAGFALTWVVGLGKGVSTPRIFARSLVAAALFWMLGAFMARYAFRPHAEDTRPADAQQPGTQEP